MFINLQYLQSLQKYSYNLCIILNANILNYTRNYGTDKSSTRDIVGFLKAPIEVCYYIFQLQHVTSNTSEQL